MIKCIVIIRLKSKVYNQYPIDCDQIYWFWNEHTAIAPRYVVVIEDVVIRVIIANLGLTRRYALYHMLTRGLLLTWMLLVFEQSRNWFFLLSVILDVDNSIGSPWNSTFSSMSLPSTSKIVSSAHVDQRIRYCANNVFVYASNIQLEATRPHLNIHRITAFGSTPSPALTHSTEILLSKSDRCVDIVFLGYIWCICVSRGFGQQWTW